MLNAFILRRFPSIKSVIERFLEWECSLLSSWSAHAHCSLMAVQWGVPPQPEHFDHCIDLYYQWRNTRNPLWLERGVYGNLVQKGGRVLELSCGDGFNARNFYSLRASQVIACDFDKHALAVARRKHSAPNIEHVLVDIRQSIPDGPFDNVVWDGAIEHFTPAETYEILKKIKSSLAPLGVLSGYTLVESEGGTKALTHHEYEFKSKEDLLRFLTPHFEHVTVFETKYPNRHNLYFWASDGVLPFREGCTAVITESNI